MFTVSRNVAAAALTGAVLTVPTGTLAAAIRVDQNTILSTDVTGNVFQVGVGASNVVLTVVGGAQVTQILGFGDSTINVRGGTTGNLEGLTSAFLHVSGGSVGSIYDYTNTLIDGGSVNEVQLRTISNSSYSSTGVGSQTGGTIDHVLNQDGGTFAIKGGSLTDYVFGTAFSTTSISGGSITGVLYSLDQYDKYVFSGTGIKFTNPIASNAIALQPGFIGLASNPVGTFYDLTGTLQDGTPINTKFFSTNLNPLTNVQINNAGAPVGTAVPEAPGLLVFCVGLLSLAVRRFGVV